jgi:hypothetical protein
MMAASSQDAAFTVNAEEVPTSKICPYEDVCYQLNIPNNTASTGEGDIYFQLRAKTEYQWVALGQGTMMIGANMFIMYQAEDGKNVTISSRYGTERSEPQWDSRSRIHLLPGSGVEDGYMTANLRCADCDRWASGYMDFTERQSGWIYAVKKGDALRSDDVEAHITKHDNSAAFNWPLANAKGGDSMNPFTDEQKDVTTTDGGNVDASTFVTENLPNIHGGLATLAFVVLFPLGGILIRLANFRGGIWIHVIVQIIAWIFAIGAIASGIRLATTLKLFVNAHPIIGILLAVLLIGQPIYGFIHHRTFKKLGHRTAISYVHLWFGRTLIFVGMINGGLGILLAGDVEQSHVIVYGVVAAVLAVMYILAILWGERRRKKTKMGPQGFRRMEDQSSLIGKPRGGDEQGLAQPEGQEMRRLWLQDRQRESTEYTPLAVGEGYGDEGRSRSRPGSRQPSPSGRYDDHQRSRSMDSRARASMA